MGSRRVEANSIARPGLVEVQFGLGTFAVPETAVPS